MALVQVIDFTTSKIEEMAALQKEQEATMSDTSTVRRVIRCEDRDRPGTFVVMAFFDSYESAMENSNRPETAAMAEKMAALVDEPPHFYNLEVIEDTTF